MEKNGINAIPAVYDIHTGEVKFVLEEELQRSQTLASLEAIMDEMLDESNDF